jgi:hypothetical protein
MEASLFYPRKLMLQMAHLLPVITVVPPLIPIFHLFQLEAITLSQLASITDGQANHYTPTLPSLVLCIWAHISLVAMAGAADSHTYVNSTTFLNPGDDLELERTSNFFEHESDNVSVPRVSVLATERVVFRIESVVLTVHRPQQHSQNTRRSTTFPSLISSETLFICNSTYRSTTILHPSQLTITSHCPTRSHRSERQIKSSHATLLALDVLRPLGHRVTLIRTA